MTRVTVLGGGLVGGFIARTMHADEQFDVTLADADGKVLAAAKQHGIPIIKTDLSRERNIEHAIEGAELVIGALPGWLGYRALEAVLEAGKPAVDISFFPEDPFELDELAIKRGVAAVVDCGVMPGLGGMIAAQLASRLDEPQELAIYVGGLPVEHDGLLDYKAPFSPSDVLEEYTRPARLKRGGQLEIVPALSEVELIDGGVVGQLEAFNTDGLRTLLKSFDFPEMKEKTLRYPGHAMKISLLKGLGLLSENPLDVTGIVPLALTEQVLRRAWRFCPGEREFTFMRVEVGGRQSGVPQQLRCELLDFTDGAGNMSMARTTGLPAIAAAKLLARGRLAARRPGTTVVERVASGIVCPEWLGATASFADIEDYLAGHGIRLSYNQQSAPA